jgi:hypothetical protein
MTTAEIGSDQRLVLGKTKIEIKMQTMNRK